ncbi:MAG TPA: carboxypeptidase-like regulatory domain-containing protein, partial [Vicinamibacteria bacterium]
MPANDGTVKGQVRASDDFTPLVNYNGVLRPRNAFLDRPITVHSQADGQFEVRANLVAEVPPSKILVPRGDYDLVFELQSPPVLRVEAQASGTFTAGASLSTRDVVFSQTGLVTGTVKRASGATVPGARVTLRGALGLAEVVDNGAGFRFPVVPPGAYEIFASLPAGGVTTPILPLVVSTGVQPPVPLVFSPFGSLTGTMRTHAGFGFNSCSARIVVNAATRVAYCGAGGTYNFADAPPGEYTVTAIDSRSQVVLTKAVVVSEGPATLVPDFVFPAVGSVNVTVTSVGGPLYLARVYWSAPALGPDLRFAGYTDVLGKKTIPNVPGSGVVVEVVHAGSLFVKKTGNAPAITFDGQAVALAIDLPAPLTLQGGYRSRDGRSVTGTTAKALSADGSETYATDSSTSAGFTLEGLPPLPIRLRGQVVAAAFFIAERDLDLSASSGTVAAEAPLPFGRIAAGGGRDFWEFESSAGASVNVRLIGDAEGAVPAPDVVVQVVGPDGSVFVKGDTPATKDASLIFTVPVTGRYVAIASARGTQTGLYKLGSSSSLRVYRDYTGSLITGRVLREGGLGAPGLKVVLTSLSGRPFAVTGPDGGYSFPDVLPGPATVEVFDSEGVLVGQTSGTGALPDLVVPGRGTATSTATRLGAPLSGLSMRFTSDHPTALAADKARQKTTNASGFTTSVLPVGLVRAEANDPVTGLLVVSAARTLEDGGTVDLPLVFPDLNTNLSGTVR